MILEKTYLRPRLGTYFKYLILLIVSFWLVGAIIYIFTSPHTLEPKLFGWWNIMSSILVAIGLTIGTRRLQLVIADPNDLENVQEWTMEFLTKDGLTIKYKSVVETTLESNKSYYRLFSNWFGTELISVRRKDNTLIVTGPFRLVDRLSDSVDLKLRFGKSVD